MKLEIEITEDEIRSVFIQRVKSTILAQANHYSVSNYIKECVNKHWKHAVDQLVA